MSTYRTNAWSRGLAGVFALVALLGALAGCVTNEATGRSQFNSLSREEEIALGDEAKGPLTEEYGGKVNKPDLQAYVTEVGTKMLPGTEGEYKTMPWEFTLLDSEVINAFALPGGKVFITRGLASKMTNEAQLAGVLGHEIGHVTAEHADKRISSQLIFTGILVGVAVAAGTSDDSAVAAGVPLLVGVGGTGFLMKFGREEELEADRLGVRYMTRAGYDPMGQVQVMEVLKEASKGAGQPEFMSTHPLPETRIERLKKLISEKYAQTQGNPEYQLYEIRYEQRYLSKMAMSARGGTVVAGLGEPAEWCGVCRERGTE